MTTERTWPTLRILFRDPPETGKLEALLAMVQLELDPLGIEEFETGGNTTGARFFFAAEEKDSSEGLEGRRGVLQNLAERFLAAEGFGIEWESLPDQDWGREWRRHFHTMRVGDRVYVGPPWEGRLPDDAPSDAKLILIDPGQAFGTGSHETTQLCLRLLEQHIRPDTVLLDVGTGSGVLSIGAICLGACEAIGTEYDPVCEENFHINADLNGVTGRVHFILGADPAEGVREAVGRGIPKPTLIVCNMLSERFYPLLGKLRSIGLPLLLSGFMVSEEPSVRDALKAAGFSVGERYQLVEWTACLAY